MLSPKPAYVPRHVYLPAHQRNGLGYSAALSEMCGARRGGSKFLQNKKWILDSLECDLPALVGPDIWSAGRLLLNVGAGSGEMDRMWEEKYGVKVTSIDIVAATNNSWTRTSGNRAHHAIGLYDGRTLSGFADRSYDAVLFVSVLHHAAENAPNLLLEASRVARKYVIVMEDLGSEFVRRRHHLHDKRGIFRTLPKWHELMTASKRDGFRVVMDSPVGNESAPCYVVKSKEAGKENLGQLTDRKDGTASVNVGSPGCRSLYQRTFVAQRTSSLRGSLLDLRDLRYDEPATYIFRFDEPATSAARSAGAWQRGWMAGWLSHTTHG